MTAAKLLHEEPLFPGSWFRRVMVRTEGMDEPGVECVLCSDGLVATIDGRKYPWCEVMVLKGEEGSAVCVDMNSYNNIITIIFGPTGTSPERLYEVYKQHGRK